MPVFIESVDPIESVDREELYEQAWSTPMCKRASKYGVSDVGPAKAGKWHNIARPSRGYGAKLEHGKQVTPLPLPLPPCDDPHLHTVCFEQAGRGSSFSMIRKESLNRAMQMIDGAVQHLSQVQ